MLMTVYDPKDCQGDWIQTFGGRKFHPLRPVVDEVFIEDIAHALSNLCRWTGHSKEFYSIAQHCVLVSDQCPPELSLWGLLHDAPEAYIGDLNRPFKHSGKMNEFIKVEDKIMEAIAKRFRLFGHTIPSKIKEIDNRILQTEARDLLSPLVDNWSIAVPYEFHIDPAHPRVARIMFLQRFYELMEERDKCQVTSTQSQALMRLEEKSHNGDLKRDSIPQIT